MAASLDMKIKLDYHSIEPLYWQAVLGIKRLVVTDSEFPFSAGYVQKVMTRQTAAFFVEGFWLGLKFVKPNRILECQHKCLMQEEIE